MKLLYTLLAAVAITGCNGPQSSGGHKNPQKFNPNEPIFLSSNIIGDVYSIPNSLSINSTAGDYIAFSSFILKTKDETQEFKASVRVSECVNRFGTLLIREPDGLIDEMSWSITGSSGMDIIGIYICAEAMTELATPKYEI